MWKGKKMRSNFAGGRVRKLESQATKHRIQGGLLVFIILVAMLIPGIYFLVPMVEAQANQTLIEKQEKNKVIVLLSTKELTPREHIKESYNQRRIDKENIPAGALTLSDLSNDYIVLRKIKENTILTKSDVISLNDLVPDSRRYQEYEGVIDVPTGLEEYSEKIVVDIRYLNLDLNRNEVILSKKELPLLIGTTLWLQLEDERERKLMDSAIKEKEQDGGSLILTIYTDPDIQEATEITYVPLDERGLTDEALMDSEVIEDEKQLE